MRIDYKNSLVKAIAYSLDRGMARDFLEMHCTRLQKEFASPEFQQTFAESMVAMYLDIRNSNLNPGIIKFVLDYVIEKALIPCDVVHNIYQQITDIMPMFAPMPIPMPIPMPMFVHMPMPMFVPMPVFYPLNPRQFGSHDPFIAGAAQQMHESSQTQGGSDNPLDIFFQPVEEVRFVSPNTTTISLGVWGGDVEVKPEESQPSWPDIPFNIDEWFARSTNAAEEPKFTGLEWSQFLQEVLGVDGVEMS